MKDAVLIVNAGSSSIKFAVFAVTATTVGERLYDGAVTGIGGDHAGFRINQHITNDKTADAGGSEVTAADHVQALHILLKRLEQETSDLRFVAVGHRVVHGGTAFCQPVVVDENVLAQLKTLIPLAPLHQPHALFAIESLLMKHPQVPQVACFDTAFHMTMPWQEQQFPLPREFLQQGVRRYGFHGLSYEYISSILPAHLGNSAHGKVVIAHLGHGVSMCALSNNRSVATTMSFTPLDGLPMGTRSGAIDPAIVLYLLAQGMTVDDISDLLYHRSGLLGLSGFSGDMHELLASSDVAVMRAIDYFCYRVSRELGSLAGALGGLDALVFTGGIGEHAATVREKVCRAAAWLGLDIDLQANQNNRLRISADSSAVSIWVMPTDEEQVIARHTAALLSND